MQYVMGICTCCSSRRIASAGGWRVSCSGRVTAFTRVHARKGCNTPFGDHDPGRARRSYGLHLPAGPGLRPGRRRLCPPGDVCLQRRAVQYPAYLSERFPTEVRATAVAFCFHQGAIWGGLISPALGLVRDHPSGHAVGTDPRHHGRGSGGFPRGRPFEPRRRRARFS